VFELRAFFTGCYSGNQQTAVICRFVARAYCSMLDVRLGGKAVRCVAVLLSFCLVGCGVVREAHNREQAAQLNEALNACGPMQAGPTRWAQCQSEAENKYWGDWPYRDLLNLKQARRAEITSRLERKQITVEQANVELATMVSEIVSESTRRETATRSVSAQQAAAAAAYMGAMRASMPRQPTTCIRTGSMVTCN
jgi:hypothetical protein